MMTDNFYKNIDNHLWEILSILKKENISYDDYYVVLLLLTYCRENLSNLNIHVNSSDIRKEIEKSFSGERQKIFKIYKPILEQISEIDTIDILIKLLKMFKLNYGKNYSSLFDYILFQITNYKEKFDEGYLQPLELTKLINYFIDITQNAKVYNPFAGLASFGAYLPDSKLYYAQEYNLKIWAVGALRLIAFNKFDSSKFLCENSIINWPPEYGKYDLIVSNPPLGVRFKNSDDKLETIEQFVIKKGLSSLSLNGKLILVLPQKILYSSEDKKLRKYLVENDYVEAIISLPAKIINYSNVPLSIAVFSKNKEFTGKIKVIDGQEYFTASQSGKNLINNTDFEFLIRSMNQSKNMKYISNKIVAINDYNLHAPRYFVEDIGGIKLSELIRPYMGEYFSTSYNDKRYVRIRDLKELGAFSWLDEDSLEVVDPGRPSNFLTESCLLFAMRWRSLKPTFFYYNGNPIRISKDIMAFKVISDKVVSGYLLKELQKEYVQKQLNAIRVGNTVPIIHVKDLLSIQVKLPSIEEQKTIIEREFDELLKYVEKRDTEQTRKNEYHKYNEFASLKHTLGRPRQNILDWTDNLLDFLSKVGKDFNKINEEFKSFYQSSIIEALDEIKNDIDFITRVLEKGVNGSTLDGGHPISLFEINKLINKISVNGWNFKQQKIILKNDNLKSRGIFCNQELFNTLIDNILMNAKKHAFSEEHPGNEVIIGLEDIEDDLILSIKNNGSPFPKNFTKEKFILKFSTADNTPGGGIGGYDINRIATYFGNPDWELLLDKDPIYPVEFRFTFKIIPMEQ